MPGLDDSVSKDKVVDTIVSVSGCTADIVTVSGISNGPGDMMTIVVRWLEAGKRMAEKGRILVWWSSAKVHVFSYFRLSRYCAGEHDRPHHISFGESSGKRCGRVEDYIIVGFYFSPNRSLAKFEIFFAP